jgi:Fur family zinc uptake transcriptional regulator
MPNSAAKTPAGKRRTIQRKAAKPKLGKSGDRTAFGTHRHDHQRCIDDALDKAAELCADRDARLTELRRQVLELVWSSHEPVGAYAVLERLQRDRGSAAPPTVYRALDFLMAQGLIHRIESLNAFVGCPMPDRRHHSQFLICTGCGGVAEIDDPQIDAAISRSAENKGFSVERLTVELQGRCPACGGADAR